MSQHCAPGSLAAPTAAEACKPGELRAPAAATTGETAWRDSGPTAGFHRRRKPRGPGHCGPSHSPGAEVPRPRPCQAHGTRLAGAGREDYGARERRQESECPSPTHAWKRRQRSGGHVRRGCRHPAPMGKREAGSTAQQVSSYAIHPDSREEGLCMLCYHEIIHIGVGNPF